MNKKMLPKTHKRSDRALEKRLTRERILIVCEGKETEPNYFKKFKEKIDTIDIDIIGKGGDPVNLVKNAIKKKEKYEEKGKPYNQVWCVFDKDEFTDSDFDKAIQYADKNGINTAYSNQSFELWFILHFEYMHSAVSRKDYCLKLNKYLNKKYDKSDPNIYDYILEKQGDAIKYSKKLIEIHNPDLPYSRRNPSTKVYELVEHLNNLSISEKMK
jgi:hypothetical protein